MLKAKSILEIVKGEKVYQLLCDPDSPLGEIHDVLVQLKAYVVARITEAEKQASEPRSDVEDAVVETIK